MDERSRPDLEGVRRTQEDVGELPVPRSAWAQKGRTPEPAGKAPVDEGRVPAASPRRRPASEDERQASLRSTVPRASRTPEQLGRALGRLATDRTPDPQEGKEGGPPLPGERGIEGDLE